MKESGKPGAGRSLREPGAVLLVSCYELGRQPLGTAWPAAFLERAGFAPAQIDLAVEELDAERVRTARLIALSVPMHTALRIGVTAARRIRVINPDAPLVFYGLYALLNADYLRSEGAAAVLAGEAETALVELVEHCERSPGALPPVRPPVLARLDFPVPSRAALPAPGRYAALERDGERLLAGAVEATRGCLHLCSHCPIPPVYGGRFFVVPPEVVLADVRQQVGRGARHITFGDPDFLNGPAHAMRVARALHGEFPEVTFDFTAKIEHLVRHRARLAELRELGCLFVISAVESLSDRVLAILDKRHDAADVRIAAGLLRDAGIAFRPTFVPFTPWTTRADYVGLFEFVAAEGLVEHVDPVQYALRLLVPPGSLLLEHAEMRPHLRGLDAAAFTHRWEHPDPEMDRLQREAMRIVREAATRGAPAAETFATLGEVAKGSGPARASRPPRGSNRSPLVAPRPRPPRLTEPWFC